MRLLVILAFVCTSFLALGQTPVKSIPFELFGDHIIIQLNVDGSEPLDFIFDSGDGLTVIDQDVAEALGLEKHDATINNGTVRGSLIKHNTLAIGDFLLEKNIKVYATDLDHLEISLGRDFDGIIGYDLMMHHAVRIDYENKIFEVYNHGEHPKVGKAIPFKLHAGIPTVEGNVILNNGETHPGSFFVMTGAGTTMDFNSPYALQYDVAHKTGDHYSYMVKSISNKETKHYEGRVQSFSFGGEKFDNIPVGISEATTGVQADKKIAGIIGNEILMRYNLEFDMPAKMIYIEKNGNYDKPFRINCSGLDIQLSPDKQKVLIHQVFENSPAEAAGIQQNDELLKLNGMSMSEIDMAEAKEILKTDGETVKLVILQNGTEKAVTLELKQLL
ncbi:aspartyl protease family protein [Reichenbachiella agariperforans]|uniref:aspartyl protease family protein n=1 Tax=Reichenbachiella agariperforans TaxID=156994 RepID=UPI001C0A5366|nr:aspartyl protease family protein [Reichenbachiella agariperforans]MBU2915437.1 aspartyl protease family protein [Reichenbachiella agariperforans]